MDYTRISLDHACRALEAVATDVQASFGTLDARQVNWRPDATKWSVAQATRKFTASPLATPATSDIGPDIVDRFLTQDREIVTWLRGLDELRAARVIMTSPFVKFITYSVLDGGRLVVAHDHRHIEQARQVTQSPGFPERVG